MLYLTAKNKNCKVMLKTRCSSFSTLLYFTWRRPLHFVPLLAGAARGAVFWPKSLAPKTNQHSILLSLRITLCHLDKRRTLIAQLLPRRKSCSAPPRPMTAAEMADIHPVQQFLMRVSVTWVNLHGIGAVLRFNIEKSLCA